MTATADPAGERPALPAGLSLGPVSLTVSDLARSRAFYEQVIGLTEEEGDERSLRLGVEAGRPLVELHEDPDAPALDPGRTGLFHLALLVPSRQHLASALMRLVARRWPLDGASDHLVSEALYLSDPDGNGIEIYRDRPRAEWHVSDAGELQMATLPLDLDDLAGELRRNPTAPAARMADGTRIGHVHLQVRELGPVEAFYHGLMGFDVVVRGYPGALFVSAGGYHHHLGLNTWRSRGAEPPPPGAIGLRSYQVVLPDPGSLAAVRTRLLNGGVPVEEHDQGLSARDPSGNALTIVSSG